MLVAVVDLEIVIAVVAIIKTIIISISVQSHLFWSPIGSRTLKTLMMPTSFAFSHFLFSRHRINVGPDSYRQGSLTGNLVGRHGRLFKLTLAQ